MPYIEETLTPGEEIRYRAKAHWIIYTPPLIIIALSLIVWLCASAEDLVLAQQAGIIIPLSLVWLGIIDLKSRSKKLVLTNKRLIQEQGFPQREITELQLDKTQGIVITDSPLGRRLGFGDIKISTGGIRASYRGVAKPFLLRQTINQIIDQQEQTP